MPGSAQGIAATVGDFRNFFRTVVDALRHPLWRILRRGPIAFGSRRLFPSMQHEQSSTAEPEDPGARFRRVEAIFRTARRESDPTRRARLLDEHCGNDTGLRDEVLAWLAEHEAAETHAEADGAVPLARQAWGAIAAEVEQQPERIGRYRILRLIGAGGMGTVYEAVQEDPERRVALKLLHPELDDRSLRRRFRTEAEVLARLHHDGIATLYDVGEVETQLGTRLYIAMECVEGLPLRAYLEQHDPAREERLALLLSIGEAVRHAHRNGVIHRDLKPSNILVRPDGAPKLLDFGVARRLDVESDLTRTGHVVGTFRYMAPEQAGDAGMPVDSRADIYALGVIGYEMLSGAHPRGRGTTASTGHGAPVPSLGSRDPSLRGDLSIIFGKALEPAPGDRYADVDDFVEDLRRYLASEPIRARPRSSLYLLRKFVARNRGLVASLAVAVLSLVAGLAVAIVALKGEEAQRERADATAARAEIAAYVASIKAAGAEIAAGTPLSARSLLAELPARQRGWEWDYLWQQLDGCAQRLPIGTGTRTPDRIEVGVATYGSNGRLRRGTFRLEREPARRLDIHAASGGSALAVERSFEHGGRIEEAGVRWERTRTAMILHRDTHPETPLRHELGTQITSLAVDAAGRTLAVGGRDHTLRLYDARTGALALGLVGHTDEVKSLAFDAEGRRLASGGDDGVIYIWDVRRGLRLQSFLGHRGGVAGVAFLAGDRGLVSMEHGALYLWDVVAARALDRLRRPSRQEGRFVYGLDVSPDGRHVASLSFGGVLEIADLHAGTRLLHRELPFRRGGVDGRGVRYDRSGRWLAAGEGQLTMLDAHTGETRWTVSAAARMGEADFRADGKTLFARRGTDIVEIQLDDGAIEGPAWAAKPFNAGVRVSPDGRHLAFVTGNRAVEVHDAATRALIWRGEGHTARVVELRWSPDGRTLASAGRDGTVRLWAGATGASRGVLHSQGRALALAWHPDGSRLATGEDTGTIRLWDPRTGVSTFVLRAHPDYVHALAFTPDGRTLVSGSGDGSVRTWSTRARAERAARRAEILAARVRVRPAVAALLADKGPAAAAATIRSAWPEADHPAALDVLLLAADAKPK